MALSLQQLAKHLASSRLLSVPEVERLLNALPKAERPQTGEALAKWLVKAGHLTPYQAKEVYSGRTQGLVLGNYVILDRIGAGGMGQVFKAEHRRMKRIVALKVLPPETAHDQSLVARFQREVQAAAKLMHPNIVTAFDADEADGVIFLVMEYVPGKDLAGLVKQQGAVSVDQAVRYILDTARGLEYAHAGGVIHRDIKPANLLLTSDKAGRETVKVLDMGLARIEDASADVSTQADLTGTGMVMGTVDYMAPEQALNTKNADHRSDIYSLGITLYYLLTGKPAYPGNSMMERLVGHRESPIPSLRQSRADVPLSLDLLFQRMVAKQPGERCQSMAEVVGQLESLQSNNGDVPHAQFDVMGSGDTALNSFLNALDGDRSTHPAGSTARGAAPIPARTRVATAQDVEPAETIVAQVEDSTATIVGPPKAPARAGRTPSAPKRQLVWQRLLRTRRKVLIAGGLFGLLLLGGILITIKRPDGTETTVEVPAGTQSKIDAQGNLTVTLPQARESAGNESAEPNAVAYLLRIGAEVAVGTPGDFHMVKSIAEYESSRRPVGNVWIHSTARPDKELLRHLLALPALRELGLGYAFAGDEFPQALRQLPALSTLEFRGPLVDDGWLEVLSGHPRLAHLVLQDGSGHVTRAGIAALASLTELRRLELYGHVVRPDCLQELAAATRLERLTLGSSTADFEPESLQWLESLPNLNLLMLGDIDGIADENLQSLPQCSELVQFEFSRCPKLTDEFGRVLAKCPKLRKVVSMGTDVSDQFIANLSGSQFEYLDLHASRLTDACVADLAAVISSRDVPFVHIADSQITEQGYRDLKSRIPHANVHVLPWSKQPATMPGADNSGGNFALRFDGMDDSVEIPSLSLDPAQPFTVEAVVSAAGNKAIPADDASENFDPLFSLNGRYAQDGAVMTIIHDRQNRAWWLGRRALGESELHQAFRKGGILLDQPIHLAVVFDGTSLQLFEEGRLLDIVRASNASPDEKNTEDVPPLVPTIGSVFYRAVSRHRYFAGEVRQFRISTISRYSADFQPQTEFAADADTLMLYRFDEGEGDVLHDASGNGHDGKIVGATWVPVAAGDPGSTPSSAVPITQLNRGDYNTAPWPSLDGLRLYWESADDSGKWAGSHTVMASRPDVSAPFGPPQVVSPGRMPTLSPDELELICVFNGPEPALHVARRDSVNAPFGPLEPLVLTGAPRNPKSPCLLGTRLVLQDGDPATNGFLRTARSSSSSPWEAVTRLEGMQHADHGIPLTWPFVGEDGYRIWYGRGGDRATEIWTGSRSDWNAPFGNFEPVSVEGQTLIGRAPRYCAVTGELFFSRPIGEKGWELAVVKPDATSRLQFDGNDSVSLNQLLELPAPLTFEVWIRPTTMQPGHIIFCGKPHWVTLEIVDAHWVMSSINADGMVSMHRSDDPVQTGHLTHVAGTWDGKSARLFVNGVPAVLPGPQDGQPGFNWPGVPQLYIGRNTTDGSPGFSGTLHEVRVSHVIRYQDSFRPTSQWVNDEQTLALYNFHEGSGDVLHDSSGNGHDGRIVGATWVTQTVPSAGGR